jgi:hypothetical protein
MPRLDGGRRVRPGIAFALIAPAIVLAQTPPLIDIGVWYGTAINDSGQVALASPAT